MLAPNTDESTMTDCFTFLNVQVAYVRKLRTRKQLTVFRMQTAAANEMRMFQCEWKLKDFYGIPDVFRINAMNVAIALIV